MRKKTLALLLGLLLALLCVVPALARVGDVDNDNEISAVDARLALRAAVKLENLTDEQTAAADADHDNEITAADARLILRAAVGLEELKEKQDEPASEEPSSEEPSSEEPTSSTPSRPKPPRPTNRCNHEELANTMYITKDTVCPNCGKTIVPSFNSLVNPIKDSGRNFSHIAKEENGGSLSDDSYIKWKISKLTRQALLALVTDPQEKEEMKNMFNDDYLLNQLKEELTQNTVDYYGYLFDEAPELLYNYYPLPYKTTVSELTEADYQRITVEYVDAIDMVNDLPDTADTYTGNAAGTQDLTAIKELANAAAGKIMKVTIVLPEEKYSEIKDTENETALMRATGIDIRTYSDVDLMGDLSGDDGITMTTDCQDVVSNCTVTYYFSVTEKGDTKEYTPLASKYATDMNINELVDMELSFVLFSENNPQKVLEGHLDVTLFNKSTDYFVFN